ncbi:MAG: hypothetical protein H7A25_11805 [Leptospiraceae bacterium]|nr:hypothetical protein [Leptospiraceae bacterium]MCP5500582.1 hypothetical protein [Leptospiraceae bacterium]
MEIIFILILSLIYLLGVLFFFYRKDRKKVKVQREHDVILAKCLELKETDEEEYKLFMEYSEKRMNEDLENNKN